MPLRWEFQLFQLDSRPISTWFVRFDRQPIQPNSSQISSVRRESKPSRCESSRVDANPRKKKSSNAAPTHGKPGWTPHPALDSGATPSQPHPCFPAFHTHGGHDASVGFGFDSKTNDYMVVRFFTFLDKDDWHYESPPDVEVCSLATGERKTLTTLPPRGAVSFCDP